MLESVALERTCKIAEPVCCLSCKGVNSCNFDMTGPSELGGPVVRRFNKSDHLSLGGLGASAIVFNAASRICLLLLSA